MSVATKKKAKYTLDFYQVNPIDQKFKHLPLQTEEHATLPHVDGRNLWNENNVMITYGVSTNLETGISEMAWTGDFSTLFGLHLLDVTPELTTNPVVTSFVFILSREIYYFTGDTSKLETLAYEYAQEFAKAGRLCEKIKESNAKTRHRRRAELFNSEKDYQAYIFGVRVYVLYQLSKHSEFKQVLTTNPAVEVWI